MQAAVVSFPEGQIAALEHEQALAICRAMPGFGFDPLMICARGKAPGDLPCIELRSQAGIGGLFRLWRWQARHERLLVLAVGSGSVRLARRIFGMAQKKGAMLVNAFLLAAPARSEGVGPEELTICGSEFIADALRNVEKPPALAISQPGIAIDAYRLSRLWQPGQRFVFGMAESLMPESGSLLVVRAMAALWQHDLPEWEVRMFGSGPRFEEVLQEAEKMGVLARLGIFGEQPLSYVAGQCSAWLAPGTAQNELPETLWAGFGACLPVICSDGQLHRERLFGTQAAILVKSGNPQEMAKAMLNLMQDQRQAARLAEEGSALRPLISLAGMADRVCRRIAELVLEQINFQILQI